MSEIRSEQPRPHVALDCDGVIVGTPASWNWFGRFFKAGIMPTMDGLQARSNPGYRRPIFPPMPVLPGTRGFVETLHEEGIVIDGVVSSRFSWLERSAQKAVDRAGLRTWVPRENVQVVSDSEQKAATLIGNATPGVATGLIEDRPDRVGVDMVRLLLADPSDEHRRLAIGVPEHPRSIDRIKAFGDQVTEISQVWVDRIQQGDACQVRGPEFTLTVTPLIPFSDRDGPELAAQQFARELNMLSNL